MLSKKQELSEVQGLKDVQDLRIPKSCFEGVQNTEETTLGKELFRKMLSSDFYSFP